MISPKVTISLDINRYSIAVWVGKSERDAGHGRVPISSGYQIEIGFGGGVGNLFFGGLKMKKDLAVGQVRISPE
jgi:hypothetical protein